MKRTDARRRSFLAGGSALLAGCSLPKRPPTEREAGFRFEPDGRSGAVVGSFELFLTKRGAFPSRGCTLVMEEAAEATRLVRDGRKDTRWRGFSGPDSRGRADFSTPFPSAAEVSAVVIPAAEHRFHELTVSGEVVGDTVVRIALPPLKFTPRADRITYIGSIAVLVRAWYPWPSLGLFAVRDASRRDVPRLRERFPWIGDRRIETALASGAGWADAAPGVVA